MLWKPIPSEPGYQASDTGLIQSPRGKIINQCVVTPPLNRQGYKCCSTFRRLRKVHRLVCEAFHGPPPQGKPLCLHKDGNTFNNTPDNLYWGDYRENARDSIRHGTFPCGERHYAAKLRVKDVLEIRRRARGVSGNLIRGNQSRLAREYGVSKTTINKIVHGRKWKQIVELANNDAVD